jgi:hexokinase
MRLSDGLLLQMKESLIDNEQCMLPSFNHQLPTGQETGTYLALDVGGSTFRVALIKLFGRDQAGKESKIVSIQAFKIDQMIKRLEGVRFFDWMAQRIEESLSGKIDGHVPGVPLSAGLAWSFPIE